MKKQLTHIHLLMEKKDELLHEEKLELLFGWLVYLLRVKMEVIFF